ncbi:MAG TPA: class I lanthipeptide [Thermoanaerobaculia bacterium]|nr:class I lanthipeptide [Thermoanaerobaculia bacterium]
MKRKVAKLSLNRETLLSLNQEKLQDVIGGSGLCLPSESPTWCADCSRIDC